jgi:hypothetical protein
MQIIVTTYYGYYESLKKLCGRLQQPFAKLRVTSTLDVCDSLQPQSVLICYLQMNLLENCTRQSDS